MGTERRAFADRSGRPRATRRSQPAALRLDEGAFDALPGMKKARQPETIESAAVRFRSAVDDLIQSYVGDDLYSDEFRREASIKRILTGYVTTDDER